MVTLHNHVAPGFSDLERRMVADIPEGGNWSNIPAGLSARVDQNKRRSAERGIVHTTYYGRLGWDRPAYTISTFFTRMGNGCFLHPGQTRLITAREAARLQTFPDSFVFAGSSRAVAMQIGNAVPPLLGAMVGRSLPGETVVDLFSGAGGMSYGLGLAGKNVVLGVESDAPATKTFSANHPGSLVWQTKLGDDESIEELQERVTALGGCDILVGGPPCQSFSTAGLRASDGRSNLVFTFAEAVRRIRPKTFVMENVLGLRSFQRGSVLAQLLKVLREAGYDVRLWDLKAELYGVPQRRRRLLLVGDLVASFGYPLPVLSAHKGYPEPFTTVREAIGDLPPLAEGEGSSPMSADLPPSEGALQSWLRGEAALEDLLPELVRRGQAQRGELVLALA